MGNAHDRQNSLDLTDISWVHEAGNDIQFAVGFAFSSEALHYGLHGIVIACDVRADVAGSTGYDHAHIGIEELLFFDLLHEAVNIVAYGFRGAGGVDGQHIGVVDVDDVVHGLLEVVSAAEDHGVLGEGRGCRQRGLTVVAGQHHAQV